MPPDRWSKEVGKVDRDETRSTGWTAYTDESFHEAANGGFYVLAAAMFAPAALGDVRDVVMSLRGRRKVDKLHWSQMDRREQVEAAKRLADAGGAYLVAVATPVPRRRQERARARCMTVLVGELYGRGVTRMVAESRQEVLDRRDVETVRGARFGLPRGTRFHISHMPGALEPVLWAADIVAGAVRLDRQGDPSARSYLDPLLEVLELGF